MKNHQIQNIASNIVGQVVDRLKSVLDRENTFTALHEPLFQGNEWNYLKDCIDTAWVSSAGKFVDNFESKLSEFTGIKHSVATVNGTAALHACLLLSGVEGGDEVLVPALSFVATSNTVMYCGAIPHFVDSEEKTLGLDPYKLTDYLKDIAIVRDSICYNRLSKRPIRAVVAMHTLGHPVDLDPLLEVCQKYNITLIEDAAESLGSYYKKRHTGHWGKLSALSFNGNKIITTGGGGAVLTNDKILAQRAKHLTTTAKLPHKWEFNHDMVGYNYRLPNLNAALGCSQIEQLPDFLKQKRELANRYRLAFQDIDGLKFFIESGNNHSNYWLNALILDEKLSHLRNKLLEETNANKIMTRPAWTIMNKLPMYKDCPKMDLSVAESLEARLIKIPSSSFL